MAKKLELRCLLFPDNNPGPIFSVEIDSGEAVSGLKLMINLKISNYFTAHYTFHKLRLYKLNQPVTIKPGNSLRHRAESSGDFKMLTADETVGEIFPEQPPEVNLHLIVEPPGGDGRLGLGNFERLRIHLWGKDRVDVISGGYSTVDLTLFNNINVFELNPRLDKVLLVREEYVIAYEAILEGTRRQTDGWRCAFLITGQPGIGKSLFLFYVLTRRLQERQHVALEINSEEFVVFDNSGVRLCSSESSLVPHGAWALSSSKTKHSGLCTAFVRPPCHVVRTSPSTSRQWGDWVKRLGASKYIMDVWSQKELRCLLSINNLDIQKGIALFQRYGPSPKLIIDILRNPVMEGQYNRAIQEDAFKLASQFSKAFTRVVALVESSLIFTVRPDIPHSRISFLSIPTSFLAGSLGLAVSRQDKDMKLGFFLDLTWNPSLCRSGGWLFENFAHVYCSNPKRNPLQAYLCNDSTPHNIAAPAKIMADLTKNTQLPSSFYWRPRGAKGVHAVIGVDNVVWVLQFTIDSSHTSMLEGLTEVYNAINHNSGVEWRLVVVGPLMGNVELAQYHHDRDLEGGWVGTPIYRCELLFAAFSKDEVEQLQASFDETEKRYPVDQGANLYTVI